MPKRIREATDYIKRKTECEYETGIILGTGLGGIVKNINLDLALSYSEIPDFPLSTVESHNGKLLFGNLEGVKLVAMQGRFHFYEGYSHSEVTFPLHIFKNLGVKYLIVSNACGCVNPQFKKNDLMIITSHINLHFTSPLIGFRTNNYVSTDKFYSKKLIRIAENAAYELGIDIKKGVYSSVQGPNLETKAEYRFIKKTSADVVGMSTIPEIIVAHKLGINCLGISIVTDEGFPDTVKVAKLKDILESASIAEPKLTKLITAVVKKI
ncbi:MAG: purine-nucleoside phosphorylase [Ignavibacteria bacterium]|nr:purine-nucleoside phosphorylase [Ignavibacteria bacterium]